MAENLSQNSQQSLNGRQRGNSVADRWNPNILQKPITSKGTEEAKKFKGVVDVRGKVEALEQMKTAIVERFGNLSQVQDDLDTEMKYDKGSPQQQMKQITVEKNTTEQAIPKIEMSSTILQPDLSTINQQQTLNEKEGLLVIPLSLSIAGELKNIQKRIEKSDWSCIGDLTGLREQIYQESKDLLKKFFVDHSFCLYHNNLAVNMIQEKKLKEAEEAALLALHELTLNSPQKYKDTNHWYSYCLMHVNSIGIVGQARMSRREFQEAANIYADGLTLFNELRTHYLKHVAFSFLRNFAINAVMIGIRSNHVYLLTEGLNHLENLTTLVVDNEAIVFKVLGHGFKTLGEIKVKDSQYEAAHLYFQKAISL